MNFKYPVKAIFILFIALVISGFDIAFAQVSTPIVQSPQFTYTTPNTYTTFIQITPLIPAGTGGAVPATIFGDVSTIAGQGRIGGFLDATGSNALFTSLWGIDMDASGNLYVADKIRIRKITPAAVVTTLAGGNLNGSMDGTGTAAGFTQVSGLSVAPSGNIFTGDIGGKTIRQITSAGVVTTFAGSAINNFAPAGVTTDPSGNIYVADQANAVIRELDAGGNATIYAGNGGSSFANGNAASAEFNKPTDLKFSQSGDLYIADEDNNMIRKISAGNVSTLAGQLNAGLVNGPDATAQFSKPIATAVDLANNVYVSDANGLVIRMIDARGVVVSVAGNNALQISSDGIGPQANFYRVAGLAYSNGVLFACDNTCVRKIIVTGYTIDKPLPIGLIFDSATGAISGAPLAASPTTTYTITGYNTGGSYSTTVTITVNNQNIPPPVITYSTPQVYTTGTAIVPLPPANTGGVVMSSGSFAGYTVNQPLPAGLTLDPATGVISGTPTVASPATDYQVTANNAGGSDTFTINITVVAKVLPAEVVAFGPIPAKTYGDADFDPAASSTNTDVPVTYSSDNPSVATIVNGQIRITGAGTANITAAQAGDGNYTAAAPITVQLTVNKAVLTVKANDQTRSYGLPNPVFTVTYTGFVYNDKPAQLIEQATATTAATQLSPVGTYPIMVSGAVSNNYSFNPVGGTLTIVAAPPNIVIPTAFTPNGDGYNDLWNIKSIEAFPQCVVFVYNRSGSIVYQSKGYARSWDGTYNGSPLPTGTYYYIIDLKNGTPQLSGYVALLR